MNMCRRAGSQPRGSTYNLTHLATKRLANLSLLQLLHNSAAQSNVLMVTTRRHAHSRATQLVFQFNCPLNFFNTMVFSTFSNTGKTHTVTTAALKLMVAARKLAAIKYSDAAKPIVKAKRTECPGGH